MYDQEKKKSRGFGFLSFADENACNIAVSEHFVNIQNKQVSLTFKIQWKPLNVITLGQRESENISRIIKILIYST
jgi:RNA recognition motif-containing protein